MCVYNEGGFWGLLCREIYSVLVKISNEVWPLVFVGGDFTLFSLAAPSTTLLLRRKVTLNRWEFLASDRHIFLSSRTQLDFSPAGLQPLYRLQLIETIPKFIQIFVSPMHLKKNPLCPTSIPFPPFPRNPPKAIQYSFISPLPPPSRAVSPPCHESSKTSPRPAELVRAFRKQSARPVLRRLVDDAVGGIAAGETDYCTGTGADRRPVRRQGPEGGLELQWLCWRKRTGRLR